MGFRWWTRARALELGLVGYARNLPDGRVEVVAQGPGDAVDRLIALLEETPSTTGRPGSVTGSRPFWQQFEWKMSANEGARIARKPYWASAHGACSRDEPQPKFSPVSSRVAPWACGTLSSNAGSGEPSFR